MFEARVVCEGPTDVEVVRAVLTARLGGEFVLTQLQPEGARYGGDAGPHGGGWKGVRGWCRAAAEAGGLEAVGALTPRVDLLVIHVDADVADEPEVAVARPCPPAMATVTALESVVLGWLGVSTLPAKVALCVPSKATEAWLLTGFFPAEQGGEVECVADPARALLHRRPKFVRMKGGELKKRRGEYQAQRRAVSAMWQDIVASCSTAKHFDDRLVAVVS